MFRSYDWGEILISPPSDFRFPFGYVNASDSKFRSDHQRRWPIHISILTHFQVASSASLAFRKSSQKGHEIYRIGHHLCFRHPLFIRLRIWNKECISPLCSWKSERSIRSSIKNIAENRNRQKTWQWYSKAICHNRVATWPASCGKSFLSHFKRRNRLSVGSWMDPDPLKDASLWIATIAWPFARVMWQIQTTSIKEKQECTQPFSNGQKHEIPAWNWGFESILIFETMW